LLERFGEKSAENIIGEIESKKTIALPRFLYSLGILHVGEETANLLAREVFRDTKKYLLPLEVFAAIKRQSFEDLQKIEDVGPKVGESIYLWFHDAANERLMKKFGDAGIKIIAEEQKSGGKFAGKIFVLTGTLSGMAREEAKEKIRALGGEISKSVSKKTDYVVAGGNPGSKYDNAKRLGVPVISEQEFLGML